MNMTDINAKFGFKILQLLLTVLLFCYFCYSLLIRNDDSKDTDENEVLPIKQRNIISHKINEVEESSLSQRKDDKLLDDFLLPYPNLTFTASKMLRSHWVVNMKRKLDEAKLGKQLTFVMVSSNYFSTLLNWMVHAKLHAASTLNNLIVVCADEKSHNTLTKKGILSVVIKTTDVIKNLSDIDGAVFHARVVVRLTVLRLLSYWGFDVFQMDIDALLVKNIQPIFDHFSDTDMVASIVERYKCAPSTAFKAWKFCICTGAVLIRSNPNTGMFRHCTIDTISNRILIGSCIAIYYVCITIRPVTLWLWVYTQTTCAHGTIISYMVALKHEL